MTDRDAMLAAIDAALTPNDGCDYTPLLAFADWLDENGEPHGPGYRAIAAHDLHPLPYRPGEWTWFDRGIYPIPSNKCDRSDVPHDWFALMARFHKVNGSGAWHDFATPHKAFDVAARAWMIWQDKKRKHGQRHKNVLLRCGPEGSPNSCFGLYARPLKTKGPMAGIEPRTKGDFSVCLVFVQSDWEYPRLAQSLGFSLGSDVPKQLINGTCCPHDDSDGTVDCEGCGTIATEFISAAYDWLYVRGGETFECHDYNYPQLEEAK